MNDLPDKLESVPSAFLPQAKKINEIIEFLKPFTKIVGQNGIKVIPSDSNIVFNYSGSVTEGTGSVGEPHAFKPFVTGSNIVIRKGYVNSLEVTGADGYTTWNTGSVYLYWVELSVDPAGDPVDGFVDRGTTLPTDTEDTAYIPLFNINATGTVTSQHVRSSLNYAMCAGYHQIGGM